MFVLVFRRTLGRYRYAGYTTTYRFYGMTDDGFYNNGMAPCELGTDCSDCGVKVRWILEISHHVLAR